MYEIAVIGCGVIGLTSALVIQEQLKSRVNVTIYTSQLSPNTTGDISAGLWGPFLIGNTKITDIKKWSKATHDYFLQLWKEGHADEAGICLQAVTRVSEKSSMKFPEWGKIPLGFQLFASEQLEELSHQYSKSYKGGCSFVTLTFEPTRFLPFLQKRFLRNGGKIVIKKITDFSKLSQYDVVVNCTGLYSKILAKDDQVTPIRGQVARVQAPWHFHTVLEEGEGNYIIPNYDTVVLGGTGQYEDYDTKPRDSDTKMILEGCQRIIPAIGNASVIKHAVGLRPGRDQVRLEWETIKVKDNKDLNVIHNYGHGGSGVTLSYGCALDVLTMIREILNIPLRNKL